MSRVADKNGMIARRATQVAATTRYCDTAVCGSSRPPPFPHQPLRAPCYGGSYSTMPRSATTRAHVLAVPRNCASLRFVATRTGIAIAGGLRHHAPSKGAVATRYCDTAVCGSDRRRPFPHPPLRAPCHGRRHLRCRPLCIPSRNAECAAMWDLIRGSLNLRAR